VLAVAGDLLGATHSGRRAWALVVVLSGAVGPVLGGALTQAFSWRAIFVAQAPLPVLGAVAAARVAAPELETGPAAVAGEPPPQARIGATLALGLVSAALTALLFGLVLLLVVGWAVHPLTAALEVSLVPVAAFVGSRVGGPVAARIAAGATLVAAGIAMLAFLPTDRIEWLVAPEVVAGIGMGLSLAPLLGHLIPETIPRQRARNVAVRHLATTLALLTLAPVLAHDLSAATERAKLRTVALVLDARIDPVRKLELAPRIAASVRSENPLASLRSSAAQARAGVPTDERRGFDALVHGLDDAFVGAANDAFRRAFILAALFGLAAGALFVRRAPTFAAAAFAVSLALVGGQAILRHVEAPAQVRIADPCRPRPLPNAGGAVGSAHDAALVALDKAACFLGSSREELVLALASSSEGKRFERRHGVDPHRIRSLLDILRRS
jgi:MFS family permease